MVDAHGNELLSLDEAAQFLGISKPTLYRLLGSTHLRGIKVGRQWRFRKSDLTAYMERTPVAVSLPRTPDVATEIVFFAEQIAGSVAEPIETAVDEEEPITLVTRMIQLAITMRASDIHIEPSRPAGAATVRVRYRVDGVLQEIRSMPETVREAVTVGIKTMADMNLSERRLPQDGRIPLAFGGQQFDLRVSDVPSILGESFVIRILNRSKVLIGLDQINLSDDDLARIRGLIDQPNGVVITTGPTGSGKTTTIYSCLQAITGASKMTITVEDPVELVIADAVQIQTDKRSGLTFPAAIRSVMRQDPDVIMVGEVRDAETARLIAEASLTGHLVFTALHTDDAPAAVQRMLSLGVEPHIVAATVTGVIAQRLARRICEECKQQVPAERLDQNMLGYIRGLAAEGNYEIPKDAVFYEGRGCDQCRGRGYKGRMAIFEILEINEIMSAAILKGAPPEEFESLALQSGMRTLFADGMRNAVEGKTTFDEILRVTFTAI